jgi:hypothetical protein
MSSDARNETANYDSENAAPERTLVYLAEVLCYQLRGRGFSETQAYRLILMKVRYLLGQVRP